MTLIAERNTALSAKINRPTRYAIKWLKRARTLLKTEVSRSKNKWISQVCSEVNNSTVSQRGTKVSWDKVKLLQKGLHKPKPPSERNMCKEDGTKCVIAQENAKVFKNHFQKLYGEVPSYNALVINLIEQLPTLEGFDSNPTDNEITKAVKGLGNKAPGDSGVTPRMLGMKKRRDHGLDTWILF